jgi:hypothetical protein
MSVLLPFLSTYDPVGTSEGTLDPLGLYQIADQLAVQLVPAVRERMQRVRFLTAIAVGSLVTEGLEDDPGQRDASPYLVWEWLVVEALVRHGSVDHDLKGVAGRHMARRAIDQRGYLDARSYLKTPRIFGIHGVYKRLAVHLGLVNVHLGPGPNAERLADAWARGVGLGGWGGAKPTVDRWRGAVRRSLAERPPRTKAPSDVFKELAEAFAPAAAKARERKCITEMLLSPGDKPLGALPQIWELQDGYDAVTFQEEDLHLQLGRRQPGLRPLLKGIRNYETFARSMQDAFDVLKAVAAVPDAAGFQVKEIARDKEFKSTVQGLNGRFDAAHRGLGEVGPSGTTLQNVFVEKFRVFSEPLAADVCAQALCDHHVQVQRKKSADGKRPWFDVVGPGRVFVRHAFREPRRPVAPTQYLHEYRGRPIGRFRADLS